MSRWHTGHSLAAGVLGGLLLASHTWTVAVLAFTLGLLAGLTATLLRELAGRVRESRLAALRRRRGLHGLERDLGAGWTRSPW